MSFAEGIRTAFGGVATLCMLVAFGFTLTKLGVVEPHHVRALSKVVVWFTLPCLILSTLTSKFEPDEFPFWWLFPIGTMASVLVLLGFGYMGSTFLNLNHHDRRLLSCLLAFPNTGYIPLPLAAAVLPSPDRETAFLYIFLLALGSSSLMWSLGAALISGKRQEIGLAIRSAITPPLVATIVGLVTVFTSLNRYLPFFLRDGLSMAGNATIPLIMFSLGGMLSGLQRNQSLHLVEVSLLALLKLGVLPLVVLFMVKLFAVDEILGFVLVLVAASPPAIGLAVMSNYYDVDSALMDVSLFWTYVLCIFTIPLFLVFAG